MSVEDGQARISTPVDLSRQVYVAGGDYELLCCGPSGGGSFGGGGSTDDYLWVTAAEVVYELTGQPGRVVRDLITFDYDESTTVEVNVLKGNFSVRRGEDVLHSGRKGLELVMRLRELTFEQAIEWIAATYSNGTAAAMAQDYVTMRVAALPGPE